MPGSMTEGDLRRVTKYRGFAIPGGPDVAWDDEIHGHEVTSEVMGDENYVVVDWKPGHYSYSAGSCGQDYIFLVPETLHRTCPQESVLKGIHVFLREQGL